MGKIWIGIAGAVGAVIGILFAPRKGSETREEIARRAEPIAEEIARRAEPVAQAARDAASKAGDAIAPIAEKARERIPTVSAGKDSGGEKAESPEAKSE